MSFDGPNNLNGTCNEQSGPMNCVGYVHKDGDAKEANTYANLRRYRVHEELRRDGIDPPTQENFNTGATLVGTGVSIVEFKKRPNGGPRLLAKVFLVKIDPPGETGPEITVGIGHQVFTGSPDRSVVDGDVVTLAKDADQHQVTVLVRLSENEWREYDIVLSKGQGPE
jgi:hypothetical protein